MEQNRHRSRVSVSGARQAPKKHRIPPTLAQNATLVRMGDATHACRSGIALYPLLGLLAALPAFAQAGSSRPAGPVAPVTAEEREAALKAERPAIGGVPADPAWKEIIDEPLELRLPEQRLPELDILRRRQWQLGLGVTGGVAALVLGLPLTFTLEPEGFWLYGGLIAASVSLPIHFAGRRMVDEPGHWGWTLAGTTAGVLLGTAMAALSPWIVVFTPDSVWQLSLLHVLNLVVIYTTVALPPLLGMLGFELGLRVAQRGRNSGPMVRSVPLGPLDPI